MVKLGFVVVVAFSLFVINNAVELQPRIVRGFSASSGQFPFYAFLESQGMNPRVGSGCGATLISDQFLVTAAHCLYDTRRLTVHLGKTNLHLPERSHVHMKVERNNFFIYPSYNPQRTLHDIGMYLSLFNEVLTINFIVRILE